MGPDTRRCEALLALLLSTVPAIVLAQEDAEAKPMPVGCFNYGFQYHPEMPNVTGQPFKLLSSTQCQTRCQNTPGCAVFGFWEYKQECWLGDKDAVIVAATDMGVVSGPAFCPQDNSACTAVPGPGFPGKTPEESRAAWPDGNQPTTLQCWPRKSNGFPAVCANKTATVLEDTIKGWPGRCKGLKEVKLNADETCQSRCFMSPMCGVWALENKTMGVPKCWQGVVGENCFDAADGLEPMRAQMVMHGGFRVLMNTMNMRINNLTKIFDVTTFENWQDGSAACRKSCLSFLLCQYWQYSDVYGCFIEHSSVDAVTYPLINNGIDMQTDTDDAATFRAGEYIQHNCPKGAWTPLPVDPGIPSLASTASAPALQPTVAHTYMDQPADASAVAANPTYGEEPESGFPSWGVLLVGLVAALLMSVVGAAVYMTMNDKGRKSSRAALIKPGGMMAGGEQHNFHSVSPQHSFQSSATYGGAHGDSFPSQSMPLTHQGGQGWGGEGSMWHQFQNQMQHHMHWPGAQQHYQDPRYGGVPTTTNMGPTQQELMQYSGHANPPAGGGGYPEGYSQGYPQGYGY